MPCNLCNGKIASQRPSMAGQGESKQTRPQATPRQPNGFKRMPPCDSSSKTGSRPRLPSIFVNSLLRPLHVGYTILGSVHPNLEGCHLTRQTVSKANFASGIDWNNSQRPILTSKGRICCRLVLVRWGCFILVLKGLTQTALRTQVVNRE